MSTKSPHTRNALLRSLSPADLEAISQHLKFESLPTGRSFEQPAQAIKRVCFPTDGIVSVVAVSGGEAQAEIGLIGREGMTGIVYLLGDDRSPHDTFVQVAGEGWCMPAAAFSGALRKSATLRPALLKYVQAFMLQTAHTAMANARAGLEQRLARWLLMAQDRLQDGDVPLTHEFLSLMLGVRRAGVTVGLQALEGKRMLTMARGIITVTDRKALLRLAGAYYGVPEAELKRLMR